MTGIDLQNEIEAKIAKNAARVYQRPPNGVLAKSSDEAWLIIVSWRFPSDHTPRADAYSARLGRHTAATEMIPLWSPSDTRVGR
jgi:hypothetical protein